MLSSRQRLQLSAGFIAQKRHYRDLAFTYEPPEHWLGPARCNMYADTKERQGGGGGYARVFQGAP